jgi:hypothetical protein
MVDRSDLREMFLLHITASSRCDELLRECQRLKDAWHRIVARRTLAAAKELPQLERAVGPR